MGRYIMQLTSFKEILGFQEKVSVDGTIKLRHYISKTDFIETCILNLPYRRTQLVICVSSQLGCPHKCRFCRSGYTRFNRNLNAEEIVNQVEKSLEIIGSAFGSNFDVTYMGIGDPLSNINEVLTSIKYLKIKYSHINKFNISSILPSLDKKIIYQELSGKIHLQFSLHSPFETERLFLFREKLPSVINSFDFIRMYVQLMKDKVCVNYLLFENFNDTINHAKELIKIADSKYVYFKLSQYNLIPGSSLKVSNEDSFKIFEGILKSAGFEVKIFKNKGTDISAGCGQFLSQMI
jgi:23S rRNA (adenine2503-C2)-methyltransferase